jgi:hypothetical protein
MTLLGVLLYSVLFVAPQQHDGGFQQLAFATAHDPTFGAYTFHLAEPDHPDKPTAWQGPLTISSAGKSCEADVSLVTAVYASTEAPFVVVVTYSGSNTYVQFITTANCKAKWKTIKAFTEGVRVTDNRLSILPGCDSAGDKSPARCVAAQVYKLTDASPPQLLPNESFQLTKETLGVGFAGQARVAHPKSAHAQIVPAK